MKSPDNICDKYSEMNINLKISVKRMTVFIEGDEVSLKFLSELIKTQSEFKKDDGFQISPTGAGSTFFRQKKGYGIYIHRLEDCEIK